MNLIAVENISIGPHSEYCLLLSPVRVVCTCRMARMASLKRMDHLRVVGSAFLTHGQVVYCGHDPRIKESYRGPCMLPPSPALYICGTDAQVSLLLTKRRVHCCGPSWNCGNIRPVYHEGAEDDLVDSFAAFCLQLTPSS